MNRKNLTIALLFVVLAAAMIPQQAAAIPAFARTHKISCSTCHDPFPRLKPFGEEFAGNGFVMPEQENERDFISAGDDMLKLNKTFPIAGRFDAYAMYDDDTEINNDLQTPWGLKLLSGGTLSKNVGYYFYFYMSERGEVAGIEDAYIHFNDIGGVPFDIMVGQFQTSDPLMKRELRLTYEDYQIYKTRIGNSQNNLAYDRGVMMTFDITRTGTGLAAMLVNGNGKPEADSNLKFDNDKYKNFGFRISQDVFDPLRIGYFYYYGEEKGYEDEAAAESFKNRLQHHGPDFTLGNGMFDLNFQYLFRRDTNPYFFAGGTKVETNGVIAELVFAPKRDMSTIYFTLLYNQIDSDIEGHDYETFTVSATHLLARNLRGNLEYTRDVEGEFNRMSLGLVSAF